MGCAIGLIALGVGYLVFLNASKEKEGLKLLGQIIGIVIMVMSLLAGLCAAKCKMMGGYCGMMGNKEHSFGDKAKFCPVNGRSSMTEAQTEFQEVQK